MTSRRRAIVYPRGMIQLMKCTGSRQSFAVRFDLLRERRWAAAWSFMIKDQQELEFTERAKSTQRLFQGKLTNDDPQYPGCPICGAKNFVQCAHCQRLMCRDQQTHLICPWCREEIGETQQKITKSSGQHDL